jgi:hypothetical protein
MSNGGRTATVTWKDKNPKGQDVSIISVYSKQQAVGFFLEIGIAPSYNGRLGGASSISALFQ